MNVYLRLHNQFYPFLRGAAVGRAVVDHNKIFLVIRQGVNRAGGGEDLVKDVQNSVGIEIPIGGADVCTEFLIMVNGKQYNAKWLMLGKIQLTFLGFLPYFSGGSILFCTR